MKKEYLKPAMITRETELDADYAQFYSYHEGCATPQVKAEPSFAVKKDEWGKLW
jgi:hypothetical protein